MQADIEYVHEKQRLENYRFETVELGGQIAKPDRIRRMIPIFESGRFYLPKSLWRVTLEGRREELVTTFVEQGVQAVPGGGARRYVRCDLTDLRCGHWRNMAPRYRKKRAAGPLCAGAAPAAQMVAVGGVKKRQSNSVCRAASESPRRSSICGAGCGPDASMIACAGIAR